jgi:phosphatidylglycerophosphatase A
LISSVSEFYSTGFYSGYFPFAPGTAGSAAALVFWPFINKLSIKYRFIFIFILYIAGCKSSTIVEKELGKNDPARVVIDEFAGMYITLFPFKDLTAGDYIFAFLAFRFFDIVKPWPANIFNDGTGGFAIMTDDVTAGIYSMASLMIFKRIKNYIKEKFIN